MNLEQLMQSEHFPMIVAGAIAMTVFIFVWWFGSAAQDIIKEQETVSAERQGVLLFLSPFAKRLVPFTNMLQFPFVQAYKANLPKRMVKAGLEGFMSPDEYVAFHVLCAILFIIPIAWLNFVVLGQDMASFVIFAAPVALIGLWYPSRYLTMKMQQRHKSVFRDLPYVMDLLVVSVEAGLDFQGGLAKVVEKGKPGPLREELKRMLNQIQLGTARVDGLRELSDRVGLSDLTSMTSALIQAARLGSSIGPILRIQSDMLRTKRSQLAEEMANKAPVKMIFPIVMFIFPSVFLILLAPVLIKTFYESSF